MTFSSFIALIFTQVVKPFVAVLVSVVMAMGSALVGPQANYEYLALKPVLFNPTQTHVEYDVYVNLPTIAVLTGTTVEELEAALAEQELSIDAFQNEKQEISLSGFYDLYTDLDSMRLALRLGAENGKDYSVYLDNTGAAVSADLTADFIKTLDSLSGDGSVTAAYDKYFEGYGYYVNFDQAFGDEFMAELGEETANEFVSALRTSMGLDKIVEDEKLNDTVSRLTAGIDIAKLEEIFKPVSEIENTLYSETETDGTNSYTFRMTGKQLVEMVGKAVEIAKTEEFMELYLGIMQASFDSVDYDALAQQYGLSEQELAEFKASMEAAREEALAEYETVLTTGADTVMPYITMLLTGEGADVLLGEYAPLLPVVLPYVHNSYAESTIYEKDSKIYEAFELSVTDGKTPLFTLSYDSVVSEYEGTITAPADAVPFGKRIDAELIQNKVGFEKAVAKGVSSIEIEWDSQMAPEDTEVQIAYPLLYVNYKTTVWDAIDADPTLTAEEKAEMKYYYDQNDCEHNSLDTSAELIENSVYLPLRQLMENAGYEVSWDAEARKAYVTVNGERIEMTGTIVDNKTYVKVRDFEKLGAVVDYQETVYYAEGWNDFYKTCYATVTFSK